MTSEAWINYFEKTYENFFIKPHAVAKIEEKHGVYLSELEDALDDSCWVVRLNQQKPPSLPIGKIMEGHAFDVFCETEEGRLLKVVGRLYPSGKFQIITVLLEEKINASDREYHRKEKELNCDE
ncbi:hypothetical protein [Planococcus donghaensis]|uniref:hypothetical protein n=1 Tax=Planococcus donghaensis TaxID=414778 RepID=UPI003734D664